MRQSVIRHVIGAMAAAVLLAAPATANPLAVSVNTNAQQLVAALVGGNPGINVVAGSEVYTGGSVATGTFTGGAGIIPFDEGVIMTSGEAALAVGPNGSTGDGADNDSPGGDADLTAEIGGATFDAAVLEFDFVPTNNVISFQYVFASEEYNEFINEFNDAFAFFLNGDNIALIPSTVTPVSINNVNCGEFGEDPAVNPQYFTSNSAGSAGCGNAGLNTEYDGLAGASTNPAFWLFATGAVNVGVTNHIKLVIADAGDSVLDSAVFLKADSFVAEPPPAVPEPGTLLLFGTGLAFAARKFRQRRQAA